MGKSTLASQLRLLGVKTLNSDVVVHRLLAAGGKAVAPVATLFPEALNGDEIDRKKLGEIVFADPEKRLALEAVIHPMVRQAEEAFVAAARKKGVKYVALDIPLLFETGGDEWMDVTLVATAPFAIQKQRVMKRKNMTEAKFHAILASQMSDAEKCERADFVVQTGLGKAASMRALKAIILGLDPRIQKTSNQGMGPRVKPEDIEI